MTNSSCDRAVTVKSQATHRHTCTWEAGCRRSIAPNTQTHKPDMRVQTHTRVHLSSACKDTVAGCACRDQRDWNVTYCYSSHLATIEDHRQLAPQCLHADLCKSLSATGCCGALLSSFNYLGIRSLVQLIN